MPGPGDAVAVGEGDALGARRRRGRGRGARRRAGRRARRRSDLGRHRRLRRLPRPGPRRRGREREDRRIDRQRPRSPRAIVPAHSLTACARTCDHAPRARHQTSDPQLMPSSRARAQRPLRDARGRASDGHAHDRPSRARCSPIRDCERNRHPPALRRTGTDPLNGEVGRPLPTIRGGGRKRESEQRAQKNTIEPHRRADSRRPLILGAPNSQLRITAGGCQFSVPVRRRWA